MHLTWIPAFDLGARIWVLEIVLKGASFIGLWSVVLVLVFLFRKDHRVRGSRFLRVRLFIGHLLLALFVYRVFERALCGRLRFPRVPRIGTFVHFTGHLVFCALVA